MADEKLILTPEQAISMLPGDEEIHTYRRGASSLGAILCGADWSRADLIRVDYASLETSQP